MEKHQTQLPPGAASTISPPFSFSLPPSTHFLHVSNIDRNIYSETDDNTIVPPSHVGSYPETEHKIQSALLAEIRHLGQADRKHGLCMLKCKQCVCVCPDSVLFPQNGDTSAHHHLKARMLHNTFLF